MSDAPKSAYELAMEKLRQQDRDRGEEGPSALTDAQKKAIAEIRRKAQARLAEMEILHTSERAKTLANPEVTPEAIEKMEENYALERRRVDEQMETEIRAARAGRERGKRKP